MDFDSIGEIIATRMLHLIDEDGHKRPVSIFIGKPEPSADAPGYNCPYQIIGIGTQETLLAHGYDSIQALQTALILIAASLNQLNDELGCRLIWGGSPKGELGFP